MKTIKSGGHRLFETDRETAAVVAEMLLGPQSPGIRYGCSNFVETNLTRKRLKNPEFPSFVLGKIPIGKLAEPEDIASAVVYLAGDEARMVNCAVLPVDGGWTAW